ncbi:MAG: hypothetical protein J3K34DRAFT_422468 [Monoraphidium minutum]|nr:MAG: hypothetical protein J3K34DRAFT_422468 [Monoraphidium minutum]
MACGALLLVLLALAATAHAQPKPPAWACGQLTDYYAKVTTECADKVCNAAQRDLGGDVLVLDVQSYGQKSCQGCNPSIPSTCCEACKDQDGCNAWVVCTKKEGCGSGCQAYIKQFKAPLAPGDKLPHKMWGNWGTCQGDKWPFGMCSLKTVADVKKPPVTSTNAADGWVSGVVPKSAADPKCPPTLSAKSCKLCLGTKNAAACFDCLKKVNNLEARQQCATCASLPSRQGQDACVACASAAGAARDTCTRCLDADCSEADCLNARNADPSKAPNLGAVDQCFACQAAGGPAKAGACPKCFEAYSVPKAARGSCLSCVASSPAAAAAGCAGCNGENVKDKAGCLGCLKTAKTADSATACGACSDTNMVPASYTAACRQCAVNTPNDKAKSYCSNLERETSAAAVAGLYKCLMTAKGDDAPSSCWQCYRNGMDMSVVNKCYECMGKVSGPNTIHCSHCWTKDRVAAKEGGETKAAKCEKCVVGKDKAKASASDCW